MIEGNCADVIVAGGVESMSRAPFVMAKAETAFSRATKIEATAADEIPTAWVAKLGLISPEPHAIGYQSETDGLLRVLEGEKE